MGPDAAEIQRDIERGQLKMYSINRELLVVAEKIGGEFVVCCVAGQGLKDALNVLVSLARQHNCSVIRFHIMRRGVFGVVKKAGLKPVSCGVDENGYSIVKVFLG
jgi:hypothetical protein